MTLEIIDALYIVLIMFTSIIWTLLIIALLRVLKVLKMATEIVDAYNKVKEVFAAYKQIPEIVKETAKEYFKK